MIFAFTVIVGAVIAVLLVIALAIVIVVLVLLNRKKRKQYNVESSPSQTSVDSKNIDQPDGNAIREHSYEASQRSAELSTSGRPVDESRREASLTNGASLQISSNSGVQSFLDTSSDSFIAKDIYSQQNGNAGISRKISVSELGLENTSERNGTTAVNGTTIVNGMNSYPLTRKGKKNGQKTNVEEDYKAMIMENKKMLNEHSKQLNEHSKQIKENKEKVNKIEDKEALTQQQLHDLGKSL